MKRFLTLLLALVTLVSMIPLSASVGNDNTIPFTDVKESSWYYNAVKFTYEEGIFKGVDAQSKTFAPAKQMTRAELVMTLFQFANADKDDYAGNTGFTDVSARSWMSYAVKWASEKGYVSGVGNGKFNPNGKITRQEFAAILFRFAKDYFLTDNVNGELFASFPDADKAAGWAVSSLEWATDREIINGVENKNTAPTLSPKGNTTRAQAAQMLMTFVKLFDGSDANGIIDRDIAFAIRNNVYTEPKNIIYMIGDGMGFNTVEATENLYAESLYLDKLAMNFIPQVCHQTTYSQNLAITDSGAGGTALATGYKTTNSTIAMNYNDTEIYQTVLEMAAEKGMSTGVVVTKSVTDATPAAFTSHATERGEHYSIAEQQTEKLISGELDVLMGGGSIFFDDDYCVENGVNYTRDKADLEAAATPFLGLFDLDVMDTYDESLPTLPEMTAKAIELLSQDENGFFLMVEGSQIDSYNHDNELEAATRQAYHFDHSVALALQFAAENPDTMIIITADHETGGLLLPPDPTPETVASDYTYTTGGHTERAVPVYALGYGVEALTGILENTSVASFVASTLGYENVGTKSDIVTIIDEANRTAVADAISCEATDSGIKVAFDDESRFVILPCDVIADRISLINNARVLHIEMTNTTDATLEVPSVTIELDGDYVDAIPHREYLAAGESDIITYVLHEYLWGEGVFGSAIAYSIGYGKTVNAEFELGSFYINDRDFYS